MSLTSKNPRSFVQIPAIKSAVRKARFAATALVLCLAVLTAAPTTWAASTFNLLDARERGTTVAGAAKGMLTATFDESIKKDVLEFDYTVSKGDSVTVWVKNFPAGLTADAVNMAKIGIKTSGAAQLDEVAVSVAIRGAKGVQIIPIVLKSGWNSLQEKLDWAKIGALSEASFVVTPKGARCPLG